MICLGEMNNIENNFGPWETDEPIAFCIFCKQFKKNGEIYKLVPIEFAWTSLGNLMTQEIQDLGLPLIMCKDCKP